MSIAPNPALLSTCPIVAEFATPRSQQVDVDGRTQYGLRMLNTTMRDYVIRNLRVLLACASVVSFGCGSASVQPTTPVVEAVPPTGHPVLAGISGDAQVVLHVEEFDALIGALLSLPQFGLTAPSHCDRRFVGWVETLTAVSLGQGVWGIRLTGPIAQESEALCATEVLSGMGPVTRMDGNVIIGDAAVFQTSVPNRRLQSLSLLTTGSNIHVWLDPSGFNRQEVRGPDGIDAANFEHFVQELASLGVGLRINDDLSFSVYAAALSSDSGTAAGEALAQQVHTMAMQRIREATAEHGDDARDALRPLAEILERVEITRVEDPMHLSVELDTDLEGLAVIVRLLIPAFTDYLKRAKTAEVSVNLRLLSERVNAYYQRTGHLPGAAGPLPASPSPSPQVVDWSSDPVFAELGFAPLDAVYYSYSIVPGPGRVDLRAQGDLNGNGEQSLFEIVVGECEPQVGCRIQERIYAENPLE